MFYNMSKLKVIKNTLFADALPALDSASATTPGGPSAHAQAAARLAAHNQAAARLAAQQQAARAAQALQLARHSLAQAQTQAANRYVTIMSFEFFQHSSYPLAFMFRKPI